MIALLKSYPPSTYFFINSWTWGYEDILKAIARAFNCRVIIIFNRRRAALISCCRFIWTITSTRSTLDSLPIPFSKHWERLTQTKRAFMLVNDFHAADTSMLIAMVILSMQMTTKLVRILSISQIRSSLESLLHRSREWQRKPKLRRRSW